MLKFLRKILTIDLLIFSFFVSNICLSVPPVDLNMSSMLKQVMPSVVNIRAQIKVTDINLLRELQKQRKKPESENDSDQQVPGVFTSVASGVIVDANNGYILTNAHVVADAQSVTITLGDGHHYTAKIIGMDKPSDVALLQIKAKNLTAIPIGNSNDLKVGQSVAAIGNPFGLNQTVTSGIVSGLGRTTLGIESYENFIQTDASINPGNSGGALIDMQGNLVGINTAILAPARGSIGIGFAIPINMAKSVMGQLIEYGNVKRGVLGIGAQDITPDLASAFNQPTVKGAAVTQVLPNSPAQLAGVQVGDIVTAVNGMEVKNASDVVNTIGFLRVDSKIDINVIRNGKPLTLSVKLSDPKIRKQITEQRDPFLYGLGLRDVNILTPIHGNVVGVQVIGVGEESNAWNADIRPGDIITSANLEKIHSIQELKTAVAKANKSLLLNIIRGNNAIFLVINKEEE